MRSRIGRMFLWVGLLALSSSTLSAQERWVYRYDGPGNGWDVANSIVVGLDGNLYAAGYSYASGTYDDFTVVSLTASGGERWVYRYNGPGNMSDWAYSIIMGSDGNLYAAGGSWGSGTWFDFTVVSLTASGGERWVYRYNGSADLTDRANSIVMGSDGNLYAAGWSYESGTLYDFTVVSLAPSGTQRWVYRYNGPVNDHDEARSIVMGSDGNLYVAGESEGSGTAGDFTVVSLTDSGGERWVYRYNGPGNSWDQARSIVMGSDGNLYVAGYSKGSGTDYDFTVVSLTDSGGERWVYRYDGPANDLDQVYSIVMGSDGNLYAAGSSRGSGTSYDFTVVSLTASGGERWVYRYDGPGNGRDVASLIIMGSDGNVYAAGFIEVSGTDFDFTVMSLTDSGGERWVYRYDGPANAGDRALSIIMGSDGNLYAAGESRGNGTYYDFTVVSLTPDVGVEEGLNRPSVPDFRLWQNHPNPFQRSTLISYSLAVPAQVTLEVYDITGRLVETLVNETQKPGIHQVRWEKKTNPSGVYFYRLKAGEFVETRKMVVVE